MLLQGNVWFWAGFQEATGWFSCWLEYSKATHPDGGRVRSRINEHPFLYSAGSSRTGVREWMVFSLSTNLLFSLPCGTSMVCTSGHFPSGFLPSGRPDLPGGHSTQGLGSIFYSLSSDPGTDGGRQPPLELRSFTAFLLIHRVLQNPHQRGSQK